MRADVIDWTEQLRILNDVADLITPDLTIDQIISAIYTNVNEIIDAFQFAVGIYNKSDGTITYKGGLEDGKRFLDFSFDASAPNRLASWCIRHEAEIFINDLDKEYSKYLAAKPIPLAGSNPNAAIYVPLKLNNQLVGLITVRSIRKNAYKEHHLYILKTVGNFIVRALELAKMSSQNDVERNRAQKAWQWKNKEDLSIASRRELEKLTEREKEVLFLLTTGLPNKVLAEKLFVSPGTIKTHTLNVYQKMGVANRTSALLKAVEWGWLH
ncbi:MAG TPA: LuxR C-terminal-related transcriptional regulator [Chryseolinea sp.]